ncbi:glycoside hydrolase family 2 TIM barrel-domain containing protein [Mobilicoccus massiliensis]|uniref:glycoside hydrolase family 2 TIM barrel-domain containing protein n=1 Tax=Mobilicoccus massiliensis TaxID=1522310 RepID=UPI000694A7F9|nr:glycoside hydrolase family 2 TIM barrel-domain containing protein [Mobilicoccus massiliensis]
MACGSVHTDLIEAIDVTGREPARSWRRDDPRATRLDGAWAFRFSPRPVDAPQDAHRPDVDDADWARIRVPSHWSLLGEYPGADHSPPIYTNVVFPIPLDPPRVPDDNPTGDYRRWFDLDAGEDERVLIRFDGVESVARVHVNGTHVGDVAGSRLPTELDVTAHVRPGRNLLHVRVHQWSAQTYVEDQDQWWLPGIFREVTLVRRPRHGIDDHWLRADFDPATGEGILDVEVRASEEAFPVTLRVPELGIERTWQARGEVEPVVVGRVVPWSADRPRLYDATLSNALDQVATRVGFRRIEIRAHQWLVNGVPLRLRGVNRHEFHPEKGRVFDPDDAYAGLLLMKRHNVNAIRTAHYPPHPQLLEWCDELGFWVIDECDIETHGFQLAGWRGNPSDDPAWRANYLDRVERMVERDKNHPCIVAWSLGNESGTGANLAAMAEWIHRRDPGRPVHYESDHEGAYTDVVSRMYSSLRQMRELSAGLGDGLGPTPGQSRALAQRPMVLCEYAHAMGNGPGALAEYEELFETLEQWHGGFVWEWRDHGLLTRTEGGVEFHGYGGDFGEVVHDGSFVRDGLVLADGTPSPALRDVAAVFTPVVMTIHLEEEGTGELRLHNRYHARTLEHLCFRWTLETDGERVDAGVLASPRVAAGERGVVELPAAALECPGRDTHLTVVAELAEDMPWASAGHVLSRSQVRLDAEPGPARPAPSAAPVVHEREVLVGPAVLEPHSGRLRRLGDLEVHDAGVELWRAPTENDLLGDFPSYELADPALSEGAPGPSSAQRWRLAGLDRLVTTTRSVRVENDAVVAVQRLMGAQAVTGAESRVAWTADGNGVVLTLDVTPIGPLGESTWPRVGYHLALPPGYMRVEWFGVGPDEGYADTGNGNVVGRFACDIDDFAIRYAVPEESGHRPGLRRARITGPGLPPLRIDALEAPGSRGRLPGLTVLRHDVHAITAATHQHALGPSTATHVYLDAAQHGIGSRSCGPDVLPEYQLWPSSQQLCVRIAHD